MVMTTYVVVDRTEERPVGRGEAVLMNADNEAAVAWVKRCRVGCWGGEESARRGFHENDGDIGSKVGVLLSG